MDLNENSAKPMKQTPTPNQKATKSFHRITKIHICHFLIFFFKQESPGRTLPTLHQFLELKVFPNRRLPGYRSGGAEKMKPLASAKPTVTLRGLSRESNQHSGASISTAFAFTVGSDRLLIPFSPEIT